MGKPVAAQRLTIFQMVCQDIFFGILDRHEVGINHEHPALGREPGQRYADRTIAAAEVEAFGARRDLQCFYEHLRSLIDCPRAKKAPGGGKGKIHTPERCREMNVFFQFLPVLFLHGECVRSLFTKGGASGPLFLGRRDSRGSGLRRVRHRRPRYAVSRAGPACCR